MKNDRLSNEYVTQEDSFKFIQRYVLALFYYYTTRNRPYSFCEAKVDANNVSEQSCNYPWFDPLSQEYVIKPGYRWLSEYPECNWSSLECFNTNHAAYLNQLAKIYLSDHQVNGPLPTELGKLSLLHELTLYANNITGTIPT